MLTQINPQNYQLNMSSFSQLYYNLINRLSFTIRPIMPRPHYKTRRGVCPSVRRPSVACLLLLLLSVRLYAYGRNFRENKSVDKWAAVVKMSRSSRELRGRGAENETPDASRGEVYPFPSQLGHLGERLQLSQWGPVRRKTNMKVLRRTEHFLTWIISYFHEQSGKLMQGAQTGAREVSTTAPHFNHW